MAAPKLIDTLDWIVNDSALFADDDSPFYAAMKPGAPRLAVVVGDNATGKSLLARMVAMKAREAGATGVSVSIRERTGSGSGEMSRMGQVFMFGDETEQSTGATSVRVVKNALEKNVARPGGCFLILDEPEMGLAEGYAHALGGYIAAQSKTMSRHCAGVVVVTHSRAMVAGMKEGLGRNPTFVTTSMSPVEDVSVKDWLDRTDRYDLEALLALPDINHDRWRTVGTLLKNAAARNSSRTPSRPS